MLTVFASASARCFRAVIGADRFLRAPALWLLAPCVLTVGAAAFRLTLPGDTLHLTNPKSGTWSIVKHVWFVFDAGLRKFHTSLRLQPGVLDRRSTAFSSASGPAEGLFRLCEVRAELTAVRALCLFWRESWREREATSTMSACECATPTSSSRSSGASRRWVCSTEREEGVECCYARQTKFWITDSDWGALGDLCLPRRHPKKNRRPRKKRAARHTAACRRSSAPAAAPVTVRVWEHRLADPIPASIPFDDNSLDEARSSRAASIATRRRQGRAGLFVQAIRALRPGGADSPPRSLTVRWRPPDHPRFRCQGRRRRSGSCPRPAPSPTSSSPLDSST